MTKPFAPDDAGCWVDGHWGQYGAARVVDLAITHGWNNAEANDLAARHLASMGSSSAPGLTDDEWERLIDAADAAECWLNDHAAPAGHSFGWHDGEFFLASEAWWQE